jgi:hypothetical protein
MRFHVLYEIECPRPWGETSISDCFWEALEQVKVAEEAGFETRRSGSPPWRSTPRGFASEMT